MKAARAIANQLLTINAIKLAPNDPFTWASGIKSPIYCDNRILLSYPEVRTQVKAAFVEASKEFAPFDTIAGVATAGVPHGALLADALDLPFIYVRSSAKAHGRQNLIEGELRPDARVLVVEDLISTGGSSLKAVEALREAGATVIGAVAIFTYGFAKADRAFQEALVPLRTLSNYDVLIEAAVETGYVTNADLELLQNWRTKTGA